MAVEREVKYKLLSLPREAFHGERVSQVYVFSKFIDFRVRRASKNSITLKSKSTKGRRLEFEFTPPKYIFEFFWSKGKKRVDKTRYKILSGDDLWEIDLFDNGLIIAECEFRKTPPMCPWPGEDVTNNPKFYNSNL